MKILFRLFIVVIAVIIVLGGYTGLIPGISALFGSDKPKDLGVSFTYPQDSDKSQSITGTEVSVAPSDLPGVPGLRYEGQHKITFTMTSKEATALLNRHKNPHFPFSNLQIRFNDDGTSDISGVVSISKVYSFTAQLGYSANEVNRALQSYHLPSTSFPFYVHGIAYVKDNHSTFSISQISVGKLALPSTLISANTPQIESVFDSIMNNKDYHFFAKTLTNDKGKMLFEGSLPDKEIISTD